MQLSVFALSLLPAISDSKFLVQICLLVSLCRGDPLSSHGLEFLSIDDHVLSNSLILELSSSSSSSSFLSSPPCSRLSSSPPGHQMHSLGAMSLYPRPKSGGVDQSPDAVGMDRADLSIKRSSSSQTLDHEPGLLFPAPPFYSPCVQKSTTMATHTYMRNLNNHGVSNDRPMRKVWSTGDLQHAGASLGPTADGIPIAGRYSFEQRKERINRYRSKKTQRNFSRTIKYACRKILAEKRTRISGRFARNDDTENCKADSGCHKKEEEEEEDKLLQLWADRFLREEEETDWPAISSFGFPSSTDQFGY